MKKRLAMCIKLDGLWQLFPLEQCSQEGCQDVADLSGKGVDFDMNELIEITSAVYQQVPR